MSDKIRVAVLAVFLAAALALPAVARSITAIVEPSHGPIQISACRANFDSDQLTVSIDFKNTGEKTAVNVGFSFSAEDPFGQQLQYSLRQRKGDVAPAAEIDNWQAETVALTGPVGSDIGDVRCALRSIRFKDGTEWNAQGDESTNGYPPTPNPEGTPSAH